jgi:hypothetical protein
MEIRLQEIGYLVKRGNFLPAFDIYQCEQNAVTAQNDLK